MSDLKKVARTVYVPGSPGVPADAGQAPTPAFCEEFVSVVSVFTGLQLYDTGISTGVVSIFPPFPHFETKKIWYKPPEQKLTVTDRVCYPASAGRAPVVGVPAVAAQTRTNLNIGWNSSAVSRAAVFGDCTLSFSVPGSTIGAVCGLNNNNEGSGYQEIDHAFYCSRGVVVVYENGIRMGPASFAGAANVLSIKRVGSVVTYANDGVVFYTSLTPSSGMVFADASLYSAGDTITGAALTADGAQPDASAVTINGVSAASFLPLEGLASDHVYTGSAAAFLPLTATAGTGELAPVYTVSAGLFLPMRGASRSLTGQIGNSAATFAPLSGKSSDGPYTESVGSFLPLTGFAAQAVAVDGVAVLNMRGPYRVIMRGTERAPNKLAAKMPRPMIKLAGGATAKLRMPAATVTMTGTGVVVGRIRARMAAPLVNLSGTTGSIGGIKAVMPGQFKVQAFGGAVIEARLHDGFTVKVAGLTGSVGRIVARMPLFVVEAAGATVNVGRIEALMPMLRPVASGILRALMPMGRLTAIGTAVVALEYEGYAVNLISNGNPKDPTGNEVTHYTGFPFDQIVRHGNRYYGVSSMGLFILGGDTDEGAVIPWAARTATTDFGTKQEKAVVSVYLGGQMTPTVTATVFTGEDGVPNYTYPVPPSAKGENRRAKFGRGLKARYISLELADAQGGALALDALDIEINQLKRAL